MSVNFSKAAIETLLQRRPELQFVGHLVNRYPRLENQVSISKKYLYPDELEDYTQLEENFTIGTLHQLNRKYDEQLRWRLLESSVTDEDIMAAEKKWNLQFPSAYKNYLQSYALPIGCVYGRIDNTSWSFTYNEANGHIQRDFDDEEPVTTKLTIHPMLYQHELEIWEQYEWFADKGYILIGEYNEYYYVLLDTTNGQVLMIDHENHVDTAEQIKETAYLFFHTFDDLLRCYFMGELYDEDEKRFL